MTAWTLEQLEYIRSTDDFNISPYREDDRTPGTSTWIWSVVVDGDVYVRADNGTASRWHRVALSQKRGRIRAGHRSHVAFAPVDCKINDRILGEVRSRQVNPATARPQSEQRRPCRRTGPRHRICGLGKVAHLGKGPARHGMLGDLAERGRNRLTARIDVADLDIRRPDIGHAFAHRTTGNPANDPAPTRK